jgi:hypothetical protein
MEIIFTLLVIFWIVSGIVSAANRAKKVPGPDSSRRCRAPQHGGRSLPRR